MMSNKWVQAVLCGGIGFGLIIGSAGSAISAAPVPSPAFIPLALIGIALMFVGLWKTGSARGTDGWGGPYRGPKEK